MDRKDHWQMHQGLEDHLRVTTEIETVSRTSFAVQRCK